MANNESINEVVTCSPVLKLYNKYSVSDFLLSIISFINVINKSTVVKNVLNVIIGLICVFAGLIYFHLTEWLRNMIFGSLLSVGIGSAVVFFNILD